MTPSVTLVYKSSPERGEAWRAQFSREMPQVEFRLWPDVGDPARVTHLVAWLPPDDLAGTFPNLRVLFSVGAGVDQFDLASLPPGVKLVRMLDPGITQGMVEYVTWATLSLHREMPVYLDQQRRGQWRERQWTAAGERRVGIMGLGNLGRAVAQSLASVGFPLCGWSRGRHQIANMDCYGGEGELDAFLARCNILVCLLPLTLETRHILCARTFAQLPRGAMLINAGRGGHLNEVDLLTALDSGQISAAVLDVLEKEPPGADHPFWRHPRVWLTPHIAASTRVESGCRVLLDNMRRDLAGLPMTGEVDRGLGY